MKQCAASGKQVLLGWNNGTIAIFYLLICLFAYLLIFAPRAMAQQAAFDVTISPQFFDLSVPPGSTVKEKFRIHNNTDFPVDLKIQIKSLSSDDLGKAVLLEPDPNDESLSYIQLPVASFSARPKEWTTIPFSITLPKSTSFGYYWALVVSEKATLVSKTTAAKLNGAVAIPILLDVDKAGAAIAGRLMELKTNTGWYEYLPVTFLTTFANTGTVHTKPRGNIFISDWLGRQIGVLDINKDLGTILPHAKRQFTSTWNDSFISEEDKVIDGLITRDKEGKPVKTLKIRFDKLLDLRIGKYTAHALMVVSGPKRDYSYEATTTFFVFPWKIVLGAIAMVLFFGIGIFSTIKNLGIKIKKLFHKMKTYHSE